MAEVRIDQAALRRFLDSPSGPVGRDMRRRAQAVETAARRLAPSDTGNLRSRIHVDGPRQGERGVAYDVVAATNYALWVHQGRRAGSPQPPPGALDGWARRHGAAGAGFVIARAIAARGIKGRPFLVDALPAAIR